MSYHHGICLESLKIMTYITLFSVVLILFIQSLHRKIPAITIEEVYVPTLSQAATTNTNSNTNTATNSTTIYIDLKLYNKNPVGIYYRPMNLTFSYYPNRTTNTRVHLGVYMIDGFHQNHHKETHVHDTFVTGGMMLQPDSGSRVVVMRVDLAGRVKFKSIAQWKRSMVVGVDFEVDKYTGGKVVKTGIKLVRSDAAETTPRVVGWICPPAFTLIIFSSLFNLMFL